MIIQIRLKVFETNSSSNHAIVIDNYNFNFVTPKLTELFATGGEFGWSNNEHFDFETKFQYLISYLFQNCRNRYDIEKIKETNKYKMLKKSIFENLNIDITFKENIFDNEDFSIWPFGYIDHQSENVADEVFNDEFSLNNFLFNSYSALYTGNDNDYDW